MPSNKTILLIEDNTSICENTAEILELAGYIVLITENGTLGIEKARLYKPDLIICNILMPELNGYEVLSSLRTLIGTERIPFVFLTASAEKGDIARGLAEGATVYMTKPYHGDELLEVIEKCFMKLNDFPAV